MTPPHGWARITWCDKPEDCPNGPAPHPFVPKEALMCCAKQDWERNDDGD